MGPSDTESREGQPGRQAIDQGSRGGRRTVDPDLPQGLAPGFRQLAEGDPDFAGHGLGPGRSRARTVLRVDFEGPQRHEGTTRRGLQGDRAGIPPEAKGDHPRSRGGGRRMQLDQVGPDAHRLEACGGEQAFQRGQSCRRQDRQGGPLGAVGAGAARDGQLEPGRVGMESLLGLELEEIQGVGLRHGRDLRLGHPQAAHRHDHRAKPFPEAGLVEARSELPAQRLGVRPIEIGRQLGLERAGRTEAVGRAAHQRALDPPTVEGQAQHGGGGLAGPGNPLEERHHGLPWAVSGCPSDSAS